MRFEKRGLARVLEEFEALNKAFYDREPTIKKAVRRLQQQPESRPAVTGPERRL